MPAADPASRGRRKNFKIILETDEATPVKQVVLSSVVKADELLELLDDLIDLGHALTVGRTRDGGAIALGFMVGGKPIKRYIATREGWLALLEDLAD